MKRFTPGLRATVRNQADIDVDALLAAINEICESEIEPAISDDDPQRVTIGGTRYHTLTELAEAFELDIRDFSTLECNR
ncbi:YodD family protein [Shimwellia blattae]|uniref:Cytoplasmic protein n=1 Tax=Shimwellia blattae (strain ATCC 29907 / DSM 4481 / JCM 1650 / NBRC 105725 / CDC 9005-74) TaxID=630626 RepID=I2B7Y3_SHIBC|nr:YodD family protein [Shimwellia blattae]AFJ46637.1 hypothetical protein EBL_c15400 [Shimwellia blattae DSM 4481 = NBRC 105725]GAB80217.1 hypothetical protein YodD [Shimwellia blattae DSM 4481 = NBRC 105725]VDY64109.1 Protein of uncharacterised function (DUF2525) [Shimwellia blattae]VEC22241.1 Protein of uncharacterised function (DUF2525) [Shimwellia blattae]